MSNQVLALTTTAGGINNYRIFNAANHLIGAPNYDVFSPLSYQREIQEDKSIAERFLEESVKTKISVGALILAYLANEQGPYDTIWTNDFQENSVIYALHQQEKHGTTLIADVDDHFETVPAGNVAADSWISTRPKRIYRELLESADRPTASTPFLADLYGAALCPNFVEPDKWGGEVSPNRQPGGKWADDIVILCAAGAGRGADFLGIEWALRKAIELPNVKIAFVGWVPDWAETYPVGKKVAFCKWTDLALYPQMMAWAKPDIMISPMEHHDFNLAKSNLKWLEAGMLGACFVGEKWGEYERTVEHGRTGVLCDGPDQWKEVLPEICMNRDLREAIARRGADAVNRDWTWPAVKDAWTKGVLGDEHSGNRIIRGPDEQFESATAG